jgi:hypothetical protein
MPLPVACGERRRTNHAASAVVIAETTSIIRNPTIRWLCPQPSAESRNRSALWRASRNTAASSPAAAPAMSEISSRTNSLPDFGAAVGDIK